MAEVHWSIKELDDQLYTYKANVVRVVDGDTLVLDIDLGRHIWDHGVRLRVLNINTPEPRGDTKAEGLAASERTRQLVESSNNKVYVKTRKDDSFGRGLGEVILSNGMSLGEVLLEEGFAVPYMK